MDQDQVNKVITDIGELLSGRVVAVGKEIIRLKPFSMELEHIRNEYKIERDLGFNVFTSISDIYHRENLHSDILGLILDPTTDTIGNRCYLELFIDLLNSLKKDLNLKQFVGDVTVVREKEDRIDLLIHDDSTGIIIENKINNAEDMENQLPRYYEYVKKKKMLAVSAIVYLTLDERKEPPDKYSKEYQEYYENEIAAKIVTLPAIKSKGKDDYAHGFLDKCVEIAKIATDPIGKVYLSQYSKLVKYLGFPEKRHRYRYSRHPRAGFRKNSSAALVRSPK